MREARDAYQRAAARAWTRIEAHWREIAAAARDKKLEVLAVSYDPLPGESVIEELPGQPKSSRPQEVQVSVRLRATYTVH